MLCAGPAALAQRARLLDAVCDDAARGQASLLRRMALPLCLPSIGPRREAVRDYAVDLARAPDGIWRVSRDHLRGHPAAELLQAPVLAAFLPGLCRTLMGQSLLLASMPVWWLGDPATLALLRVAPQRYSLHPALDPETAPIMLAHLSPVDRYHLQQAVVASPQHYVATLNLQLTTQRCDLGYTPGPGPDVRSQVTVANRI